MPLAVMLVVLAGALLHAVWNAIAKSGRDKLLDTAAILAGALALALPLLAAVPAPATASLPFIAVSGAMHLVYFGLIAASYEAGDLSVAYPLMRGIPPLLLAGLGVVLFGERLRPTEAAGIAVICAGVLAMAVARRLDGQVPWRSTRLALMNAPVIAGYTLLDAAGARRSGSPLAYAIGVFVASALLFLPVAALLRPGRLLVHLRACWRAGLCGGACSVASYGAALWAMTHAQVAPVAALRETSILFGLALSRLVLHERPGLAQLAGSGLILGGIVSLRLG